MNKCPVCGYDRLEFPPRNYSICACCGTEFGYDDRILTHEQLRNSWIAKGYPWFDEAEVRSNDWNPVQQLLNAGYFGFQQAADKQLPVPVRVQPVSARMFISTEFGAIADNRAFATAA